MTRTGNELAKPDDGIDRLAKLVKECSREDPPAEKVKELRKLFNDPELRDQIVWAMDQNIKAILTNQGMYAPSRILLETDLNHKRQDLGYQDAPGIEKMAIDAVMLTWLRWQYWELDYTTRIKDPMTLELARFYDRRLTSGHSRYLRSLETLARIRKLSRSDPRVQVNIAAADSQQVNVAGDLTPPSVKKPENAY